MKTFIPIAITLLLLFSGHAIGQDRVYYHSFHYDRIFTLCEHPPVYGKDSLDLQTFFNEQLKKRIAGTEGLVYISVVVDSTGKPFCEWVENHSNLKMNKAKLNVLVDSMPNWNPAFQNGYKVNSAGIITIIFNKQDLSISYKMGRKY